MLALRRVTERIVFVKGAILQIPRISVTVHRKSLKRLVREISRDRHRYLPERSVDSLNQFFAGYGVFGPPILRDLLSFERWLEKRLFYPQDAGARWWRRIYLNSMDAGHSCDVFFELYGDYLHGEPTDVQPDAPDLITDPKAFDFYELLYAIGRKPGLYLGAGHSVHLLASYLAGYFKGKEDSCLKLTRDERQFFGFEKWLNRKYKFEKCYPWYRLVEMWPYAGLNSFECFFANYDAYLTEYGKKAHGLDDLFEAITENGRTTVRRRKKLPKKVTLVPGSRWWWRASRQES